jgi:two-component system, cell cycle response regulator
MNTSFTQFLKTLWSRPDPSLGEAAVAGELLVAKIRLALSILFLMIPLIDAIFFPANAKEGIVGISLTLGTFFFALIIYSLARRHFNPPWLPFFSSCYDITQVSCALALFLLLNEPHTAVNSKVVFESYFLAIASTSLRYDKRVCITAGLLAVVQYFAIVYYAASHWDLNSPAFAPYAYGTFSWSNQIARLIQMLAASALSLALVSRSQRLLHMATADHLTGLYNRGYIEDRFAIELSRARRYGKVLTLAVIDADCFKLLNDTHGHSAGDAALKKIGMLLRDSFRQSDTAGRFGGEEFVVLLPETDIQVARRKVESLRETVAATRIALNSHGKTVQVTISAGLASFPQDGNDEGELFATADERMFQAKRGGRNRVMAESEPLEADPVAAPSTR